MAKILEMPKLSPTMEEGLLTAWHKQEGDAVEVDDLLAEVETDKATMEFRAFDKGTLLKRLVDAGTQVKLGQPVAIVGSSGEDVSSLLGNVHTAPKAAPAPAAPPPTASAPQESAPVAAIPTAPPAAALSAQASAGPSSAGGPRSAGMPYVASGNPLDRTAREAAVVPPPGSHGPPAGTATSGTTASSGAVLASPAARRAAREHGIDLGAVQGSGPLGRISGDDVARAVRNGNGTAAPRTDAVGRGQNGTALAKVATSTLPLVAPEARPVSPMRKTIARRLTESKTTVPHFYLTIDVEVSELLRLRERINEDLAHGQGSGDAAPLKVSVNDLLIRACATALRRVPECNAQWAGDAMLIHHRVDISVAVAVPDGLVTPVVRDADRRTVVEIAREVRELAARARAKKLKPEEMQDGTFSISNLGMFGIDAFSAVINPPEGAILAVGQARAVPVVHDDALRPGKMLSMTLSCDHRVVDGAVGAAFLAELRALLSSPMRILTG